MQNTTITASFTDRDTLQLRLDLGTVDKASLQTVIPDGYAALADPDTGWVWDDGWAGRIIGDKFMPVGRYNPSQLDPLFDAPDGEGIVRQALVDNPDRWTITVNGDPVTVEVFSRKSHIADTANVGNAAPVFKTTQNLFFDLDVDLEKGDVITLGFDDPAWADVTVTYAPDTTVSEAIHVNLVGFDPDDTAKIAYLSSWNGWRVDGDLADNGEGIAETYAGPRTFTLRDVATGQIVFNGQAELAKAVDDPTNFWLNYAQADVWAMDFSAFDQPGDYVVAVDGVGTSQTFTISDDHWGDIFDVAFSGYYHQRSGVELTADATDWTHPRSLHPDDGRIVVYASDVPITDTNNAWGDQDKFEALIANATDEVLADAWGGYHDAGDWDRRTQHIEASRKLMELHERETDWSESVTANLPDAETSDALPDLLNEALFGMEFWARMQTDAGGVRGGIESDSYRAYGAASWDDPHVLYAYAPDPWTTWEFAAGAARLSRLLEPYDAGAAALWLAKAEKAMAWAEARADFADTAPEALLARNVAALDLYATTGNASYHDLFKATWLHDGQQQVPWNGVQYEAAALYASLLDQPRDAAITAQAERVLIDRAEFLLTQGSRSPFGTLHDPYAPYGWGNTDQQPNDTAEAVIAAYEITGDPRYLDAIINDVQFPLGANPKNMTFLTGLADSIRAPEIILNGDSETMGGVIPPGIVLYGDHNIHDYGQDWFHGYMLHNLFPDPWHSPVYESHQGFFGFVPSTEYTLQQGISDMAFVTGWLAAQQRINATDGDTGDDDAWLRIDLPDPWSGQRQPLTDHGKGRADSITLTRRDDAFHARGGDDSIYGKGGADDLKGGTGADLLRGGTGEDRLWGQQSHDLLYGERGRDALFGGGSFDRLYGGPQADQLFGGQGDDYLFGGKGSDMLTGGPDSDWLVGGPGADLFVFRAGDGRDRIADYEMGQDTIALDAALVGDHDSALDLLATGTFNRTGVKFTLEFDTGDRIVLRSLEDKPIATMADDFVLF